jgi:hypothetical protein
MQSVTINTLTMTLILTTYTNIMYCATNRKVASSIPDVFGIFH